MESLTIVPDMFPGVTVISSVTYTECYRNGRDKNDTITKTQEVNATTTRLSPRRYTQLRQAHRRTRDRQARNLPTCTWVRTDRASEVSTSTTVTTGSFSVQHTNCGLILPVFGTLRNACIRASSHSICRAENTGKRCVAAKRKDSRKAQEKTRKETRKQLGRILLEGDRPKLT